MPAPQLTQFFNGAMAVTADALNTFMQTCDTLTQLRAFVGVPGLQVSVRGTGEAGDGGGGFYYWDASATGPDNNNSIIIPTAASSGGWVLLLANSAAGGTGNPNTYFPSYPPSSPYAGIKLNPLGDNQVTFTLTGGTMNGQAIPWQNNGNFIVPNGIVTLRYHVVGAGGGGSGCQATSSTQNFAGAGGGAGGYAIGVLSVTPGQPILVTIGQPGAGGVGAASGSTGGTSYLGTITASGGGGGGNGNQFSAGGIGGVGTGGDVNGQGANGGDGQSNGYIVNGMGGGSIFAGALRSANLGTIEIVSGDPFGGGGGAYDTGFTGIPYNGGAGGPGAVIVSF